MKPAACHLEPSFEIHPNGLLRKANHFRLAARTASSSSLTDCGESMFAHVCLSVHVRNVDTCLLVRADLNHLWAAQLGCLVGTVGSATIIMKPSL